MHALQGLVLTSDFFCSAVIKVCEYPHYEPLSLETDIATIMQGKPADAEHFIDRMYAEIAADPS